MYFKGNNFYTQEMDFANLDPVMGTCEVNI